MHMFIILYFLVDGLDTIVSLARNMGGDSAGRAAIRSWHDTMATAIETVKTNYNVSPAHSSSVRFYNTFNTNLRVVYTFTKEVLGFTHRFSPKLYFPNSFFTNSPPLQNFIFSATTNSWTRTRLKYKYKCGNLQLNMLVQKVPRYYTVWTSNPSS